MTNKKTAVIEWLFINKARLNKKTGQLSQSVMTFDDVVEGIEAAGDGLSSRNPANFWKDITRKDPNVYWPAKVSNAGWTGADAIGGGDHACFMFVQIPAGQNTAFPAPRMPSTARGAGDLTHEGTGGHTATRQRDRCVRTLPPSASLSSRTEPLSSTRPHGAHGHSPGVRRDGGRRRPHRSSVDRHGAPRRLAPRDLCGPPPRQRRYPAARTRPRGDRPPCTLTTITPPARAS